MAFGKLFKNAMATAALIQNKGLWGIGVPKLNNVIKNDTSAAQSNETLPSLEREIDTDSITVDIPNPDSSTKEIKYPVLRYSPPVPRQKIENTGYWEKRYELENNAKNNVEL